ncbi:efflux transporter outer membrane subunit [Arenibacterium sp. CAU 1754]
MRPILAISLGVILSACAGQAPVTRDLTINLPDRYSRIAPITRPKTADLEWWRHFGDPVLNRLIAQGLTGNLSIADARARLSEAEADARLARGGIITGDGEVDINGRRNQPNTRDVRLSAEINLAGRDQHRTRAALERLEAARLGTDEARRLVLTEIAVTYLTLRFQQQNLRIRQLDLASRRRTVTDVDKQLKAGAATRLDQLRTTSLAAETQVEIPQIETEILRQRNRMATLLGLPAGTLPVDLNYQGRQPLPDRVAEIGVPADLLRARPDIRRAERLYAAAISDMDAARAARYPSLKLSGLLTAPIGGGASSSSLLGGLALPVFNQPALAAEVDAAQSRVNQAYLQWRLAVLQAVEEVETAQTALRTALSARSAAREVVTLNEEALELSRRLLNSQGNITVLDVLDRERALSTSRSVLASATLRVATGYVDLRSALGQGHALSDETTADPDS